MRTLGFLCATKWETNKDPYSLLHRPVSHNFTSTLFQLCALTVPPFSSQIALTSLFLLFPHPTLTYPLLSSLPLATSYSPSSLCYNHNFTLPALYFLLPPPPPPPPPNSELFFPFSPLPSLPSQSHLILASLLLQQRLQVLWTEGQVVSRHLTLHSRWKDCSSACDVYPLVLQQLVLYVRM